MAALNLVLFLLLLLVTPGWTLRSLAVLVLTCFVAWIWLTQERAYGRFSQVRPLTRYDLPDYSRFRERLSQACQDAGLRREPIWAVEEESSPNAMAVGGTRGVVVFTTGLLRQHPPEEVLAVVGHELQHLRSRDTLPVIIASAWLQMIATVAYWFEQVGHRTTGVLAALALLLGLVLDGTMAVVSWLASVFLAKRSRHAEYLADLAGAQLTSAGTMISALKRLSDSQPPRRKYPRWSAAWLAVTLYASHPPTDERIAALQAAVERGEVSA